MKGSLSFDALLASPPQTRSSRRPSRAGAGLFALTFVLAGIYTGLQRHPRTSVQPAALEFQPQLVGSRGALQSVRVENTGRAPLTIHSVTLAGDQPQNFLVLDDRCGRSTLAPRAHCDIVVTQFPQTDGPFTATLLVADNAEGGPREVRLTGTGIARPDFRVFSSPLIFPDQPVGGTSEARELQIENIGTSPVTIQTIRLADAASGDFSFAPDCQGRTLVPRASCGFQVTFTPLEPGDRSATLQIVDHTGDAPHEVTLQGSAYVPIPLRTVVPERLDFGTGEQGGPGAIQEVVLTSIGTAPLSIRSTSIRGINPTDFAVENDECAGQTLQPQQICRIRVRFLPGDARAPEAELLIVDNAEGGSGVVPLTGTVVPPRTPGFRVDPPQIAFAEQVFRTVSASWRIQVISVGRAPLTVGTPSLDGDAAGDFRIVAETCSSAPVPPGQTCSIDVAFAPASRRALGETERRAVVVIPHNAAQRSGEVTLTGTAMPPPRPGLAFDPPSLAFPPQQVGSLSALSIDVVNRGNVPLTLQSPVISEASLLSKRTRSRTQHFSLRSDACGGNSIAPGGRCSVQIGFVASSEGDFPASLTIRDSAGSASASANMTGSGVQTGWCCTDPNSRRLFQTDSRTCREQRGQFFLDKLKAQSYCIPPIL